MITSKLFPERVFETKESLFDALKSNEKTLLTSKKASIKMFDPELPMLGVQKTIPFSLPQKQMAEKGIEVKDGYFYPIINTCLVYDNHEDVSMPNSWTKTANEQTGKVLYSTDHKIELDKIIAWEKDVTVKVTEVDYSFLNLSGEGKAEVLYFEIPKSSIINDVARKAIDENWPVQNSARLMYVDIKLALNSSDPNHKENKVIFDEIYPKIINKEDVPDYFFAVYQQKLVREASMVPKGSNHITPIKNEPQSTHKQEPSNDTQQHEREKQMIKELIEKI